VDGVIKREYRHIVEISQFEFLKKKNQKKSKKTKKIKKNQKKIGMIFG
jgi:ABC-type phosphate/phosphonate transport system ATPase subunit